MTSQFVDFYKINKINHKAESNKHIIETEINKEHDIFKGHFPGQPVMPGVCMIQIIKEITEKILSEKLLLSLVRNIKFTAIVNPKLNPIINIELIVTKVEEVYKIKSNFFINETIALKFNGDFVSV